MTDKTFTMCGLSTYEGRRKVRFGNDPKYRIGHMNSIGHMDIKMAYYETPMPKLDAVKFISTIPEFQDEESQRIINEFLSKKDVEIG